MDTFWEMKCIQYFGLKSTLFFLVFVPWREEIFFHWCYFDDMAMATPTSSISHTHDMYKYTWMSRHIRSSIYSYTNPSQSISFFHLCCNNFKCTPQNSHIFSRKKNWNPNGTAELNSPSTIIKYFQSIRFVGRRFWAERKSDWASHVCSGIILVIHHIVAKWQIAL